MLSVDIVVLRDAGPAALGLTLDVLDATNVICGEEVFSWRVLCHRGRSAELRHGVSIAAESLGSSPRASRIVTVLGIGAATPESIASRLESEDVRLAARWLARAYERGSILA